MKTRHLASTAVLALVWLSAALSSSASAPDPGGYETNFLYDTWAFPDTNWLSQRGYAPVAFTNIVNLTNVLWLDTSNATPAYLAYNVVETNGHTNINCANGTISLWVKPDWSSTNQGGSGPGDWADLISLGQFGTNGSSWWALYFDPTGTTLNFASQTNYGPPSYYISAPLSLSSSNWYGVVLTYGPTNTALYTNGILAANGPGIAYWPGPDVTNFTIGSDSGGYHQAEAMLSSVSSYNYQLDSNAIFGTFQVFGITYGIMPSGGFADAAVTSAPSAPSFVTPAPRWISGAGFLNLVGSSGTCATTPNIWLTNVTAIAGTNGLTTITFTIAGGSNNVAYDVFGISELTNGVAVNNQWSWLGQGYHCNTYSLSNLSYSTLFLMLGAARDDDGDGVPNAYEALVTKTSSSTADTFGSLPDAWLALNGLTGSSGVAGQDPDLDGLSNSQEYLYGTKPLVSEGFNIWVSSPAVFSGIP